MSTRYKIDERTAVNELSHIRASAITLSCARNIAHNPTMDELYEMSCNQDSAIITDVPMADPAYAGLSPQHNRVIVSYSGQDTGRSSWARLICPQPEEIQRHPELLDTRDRIERLVREMNIQLMQKQTLVHTEVFFGKNHSFMGKIHMIVPKEYAKLALDLGLNFIRVTPESQKIYDASDVLKIPDLWLVCHPEWLNPSWQAWRNRVTPANQEQIAKDPEPKRLMMVFDIAYYTAYLLGARYFGEVKKACLTMIWDAAIKSGIGMPIHGSSKTLFVIPQNAPTTAPSSIDQNTPTTAPSSIDQTAQTTALSKPQAVTFITIGLSGSGKSTIGNDPHHAFLDPQKGEYSRIGNDDALVILYDKNLRDHGTVGLEDGCYNKSNDYTPDSMYLRTVQSAENVMVFRNDQGKLDILHQDILNGNGRVQTARHLLSGADSDLNTPHPDYLCLLMKDETLPPVVRITNSQLMVSMYMCLASRSTSAENLPVEQMGKLRMIPGANPFNTWGMQQEAESLEKLVQHLGCQGIVMNTGSFFINANKQRAGQLRKVTKEISLSIYPMLAQNKIRWIDWPYFPGTQIPAPGCFESLFPLFDQYFHPLRVEDEQVFCELLRNRLLERLDFLLSIKIDRRFILPIRKAIIELDSYELSTRGPTAHVENIETLLGTGRDKSSI